MHDLERQPAALIEALARAEAAVREADALRASEARYRSFFALSTVGIWRIETETPIDTSLPADDIIDACYREAYLAECNAAFARMYGFDAPEDVLGARLDDLTPRADERNTAFLRAFIESGYHLSGVESYEKDREGNVRVIENALIGEVQDGRLVRAWGTQRDLTDRVAAETAIRDLNATLEARVAARTSDLERSNRDLQSFAQVASHDLQEPLRKIQQFADLLDQEYAPALDTEGQHYLSRMRDAATRMGRLVNDLLGFARVATKTRPFAPVDLNATLQAVRDDVEARLRETGGRVEAAGVLPTVEADPMQMHQVLLNLVANGLKFHREGVPPVVRVQAVTEGSQVHLTVEDNGIGFEARFAERIFEPFQRLHGRAAFEGSGMGLAIVRRIAERHGGTVTAESEPGVGSRFLVILPLRQPESPAPEPAPHAEAGGHPV